MGGFGRCCRVAIGEGVAIWGSMAVHVRVTVRVRMAIHVYMSVHVRMAVGRVRVAVGVAVHVRVGGVCVWTHVHLLGGDLHKALSERDVFFKQGFFISVYLYKQTKIRLGIS